MVERTAATANLLFLLRERVFPTFLSLESESTSSASHEAEGGDCIQDVGLTISPKIALDSNIVTDQRGWAFHKMEEGVAQEDNGTHCDGDFSLCTEEELLHKRMIWSFAPTR